MRPVALDILVGDRVTLFGQRAEADVVRLIVFAWIVDRRSQLVVLLRVSQIE